MISIEVLQDSLFHKKKEILTFKEFKSKYSFLMPITSKSDEDIIDIVKNDLTLKEWFKVIEK